LKKNVEGCIYGFPFYKAIEGRVRNGVGQGGEGYYTEGYDRGGQLKLLK
jgi:hypothetical protein